MSHELQSTEIKDLVSALVKVQSEIRDAEKNAKGQVGKDTSYRYADLGSVIDATRDLFAKNQLVVTQLSTVQDGKPVLVTQLMHESGQWLRSVMLIMNERGTAQGFGSGLTYARRYALAAIAGITQADDDGHDASARGSKTGGTPALQPKDRALKLATIREMIAAVNETEANFIPHAGRMCKRPITKLEDMSDTEIQSSLSMLSQMVDKRTAGQR